MTGRREYRGSTTPPEQRDEFRTPEYLHEYAKGRWGMVRERGESANFSIDLAATPENALHETFFTREDNALQQSWFRKGMSGWCNPPYSNIEPWLHKAAYEAEQHGFRTVMLVPTPNGEQRDKIIYEQATELVFIVGRISFYNTNGKTWEGSNLRGSCFVVFDFPHQRRRSALATSYVERKILSDAWEIVNGRGGNIDFRIRTRPEGTMIL